MVFPEDGQVALVLKVTPHGAMVSPDQLVFDRSTNTLGDQRKLIRQERERDFRATKLTSKRSTYDRTTDYGSNKKLSCRCSLVP